MEVDLIPVSPQIYKSIHGNRHLSILNDIEREALKYFDDRIFTIISNIIYSKFHIGNAISIIQTNVH